MLLITGGATSFDNAVLKRFLYSDIKEMRIISREEKKQDEIRHEYKVRYYPFSHFSPVLNKNLKAWGGVVVD